MKCYKVCACLLIISLSLIGCSSKPKEVVKPVVTTPVATAPEVTTEVSEPKTELIEVSKLTIKQGYQNLTSSVIGTAKNNNEMDVDCSITIIYSNKDGTPLTNGHIEIGTIKAGETKSFDDMAAEKGLTGATYEIQVDDFIQNADGTWK